MTIFYLICCLLCFTLVLCNLYFTKAPDKLHGGKLAGAILIAVLPLANLLFLCGVTYLAFKEVAKEMDKK